jgi:3',5'-cyclic-nucleotide phosphodiesterase
MERMGSLQEKFYANDKSVDGWKPQDIELYKTLACGLLIKCADISNVARPWTVAEKWTQILQEEFANQGEMEKEVGMETALFGGPPELGNIYKLATSQIGFMSIFALPLFEGISDLLPQLQFTCDHIRRNQEQWHEYANHELRKQGLFVQEQTEIAVSPRSRSPPVPVVESSESTPRAVPVDDEVPPDDSDSPASSDRTESQSRDYNENNIEPVVSPDTPGPQIEITGTPMAPDLTSSRKSSSAMPDLSYFSIPAAPQSARGSCAMQYQNPITDNTNRPSGDPAVLAAALYATSATNGTHASTNTEERDYANELSSNDRPSSSRQGQQPGSTRHHAHHSSSVRTSGPSSSNRNSCTRTQSVSTYSNNMTPISPATNATSFLHVDSGDEKRVSDDSAPQSDLGAFDDSSTRPSTSYASHAGDQESNYSRSPSFTKDIGQPPSEDGNHHDFSHPALNGTRSPTQQSTTTGESIKNESPQGSPEESHNGVLRRLPKRRSRLRLAFWKRRNHHQQEVHGES